MHVLLHFDAKTRSYLQVPEIETKDESGYELPIEMLNTKDRDGYEIPLKQRIKSEIAGHNCSSSATVYVILAGLFRACCSTERTCLCTPDQIFKIVVAKEVAIHCYPSSISKGHFWGCISDPITMKLNTD